MRTIIIYSTKHGTTKKISENIAKKLKEKEEEVEVVNIKEISKYNLRIFDRIIIGGSIHLGQIQKNIKKFIKENQEILKEKQIGLFITSIIDNEEKQQKQFKKAYDAEIIKTSKAQGIIGGECLYEKMNFIEKLIIKIIKKTNKTTTEINQDAIDKFVKDIQKK